MASRSRLRIASVTVVLGLLALACAPPSGSPIDESQPGLARVTKVIDGDTIEVVVGERRESVRLIGIDTPEIAHPPEPAECFGPEASAFVHQLLPPGTTVLLSRDEESRDPYDRLLAYVVRSQDQLNVNETIVANGYAETLNIAPNTTNSAALSNAQATAQANNLGMWSACQTPG